VLGSEDARVETSQMVSHTVFARTQKHARSSAADAATAHRTNASASATRGMADGKEERDIAVGAQWRRDL